MGRNWIRKLKPKQMGSKAGVHETEVVLGSSVAGLFRSVGLTGTGKLLYLALYLRGV